MKKISSLILSFILLFGFCPAFAAGFYDVTSEYSWAEEAITLLSEKNIVLGYPNGSFNPDGNITKAEAAKLFTLIFGTSEERTVYNDINESDWYYRYVSFSGKYFLYSENFEPNTASMRKEIAYGICSALDLINYDSLENNEKYESAIKKMVELGLLKGYPDGSMGEDKSVTRAEFSVIIKRIYDLGLITEETDKNEEAEEDNKNESEDNKENEDNNVSTEKINPHSYFFVVTDVSAAVDEKGEKVVEIGGYSDEKYEKFFLYDTAEINDKSGNSAVVGENDIIYIFRDAFGKIMNITVIANVEELAENESFFAFNIYNKNQSYTFGKIESVRNGSSLEFIVKTDEEANEKITENYRLGDNVSYYAYENGEISIGKLSKIKEDRVKGKGDFVLAFSKNEKITDVLIIKK